MSDSEKWPANKVRMLDIASLRKDASNARTHSEDQIKQVARSIEEFGWTIPVLIDGNKKIIAGHGRVEAAERLGIEKVPCMIAEGWTEAQKRAYAIADNKLTLNAGWDDTLLREALAELDGVIDVGLTGFSAPEIDKLLSDPDTLEIFEIETSEVHDRFWISVRGPLVEQAKALQQLKVLMAEFPEIEVDIGTTAIEP